MISQLVVVFLMWQVVVEGFITLGNRKFAVSQTRMVAEKNENGLFTSYKGILASTIAFNGFFLPVHALNYKTVALPQGGQGLVSITE